ncbi:hypothetical protein S245_064688 [Arachis hypogaea]
MHYLGYSTEKGKYPQRRTITGEYKGNLSTWMENKLKDLPPIIDWWSYIRDKLIQIFQLIFATLKNMFLKNDYHGRLSIHSIKVGFFRDKQLRDILSNMENRRVSTNYIQDKQLDDVKALRSIISHIINLSFGTGNKPHIIEVEELYYHRFNFLQKKI